MSIETKNLTRRESLRNRENGLAVVGNGKGDKKDSQGTKEELRSKLRNRETIARPETLQYEPRLEKGLHTKIMIQSLLSESGKDKLKSAGSNNISKTCPKRKPVSITTKEKQDQNNGVKRSKPEPKQGEIFDSYAFSMQLINTTEDEKILTQKGKDLKAKHVLLIGNLPTDVTREQLEEHFRKTGGIKAIRIPKDRGSDQGRGFAYMEFDGRISLGIALRLDQTTLAGRQINVDFSPISGGKNQTVK